MRDIPPQHPRPHSDRIARLVLDGATDFAIISIDLDGKVTSWNPGAEHLLGWREAEIVGESACLFFTEEDQALNVCDQEMMKAAQRARRGRALAPPQRRHALLGVGPHDALRCRR